MIFNRFNMFNVLKNPFYYLPKNSYTFEVGYNQLNKHFFNNRLKYIGYDYIQEVNGKFINTFWEPNKDKSNIINLYYKLTCYDNNRIHTMLHIEDNDKSVKEFFYVKPHTIYQNRAKVIYGLEYNGNRIYTFNFDTIYNLPYRKYRYAVFDKHQLYDKFSQKYLV